MKLSKTQMKNALILLTAGVLMLNAAGNSWAAAGKAESKKLQVQVKRPMIRLISNVVYAQVAMRGYPNALLQMDVLTPETPKSLPGVVFITGGGFINANKDSFIQQRMALAEAGYVVASINYRVAPVATFPQPLEDVKSAIRYLKAHAAQFNLNPAKIGVFGESAGGYLAALAGTTSGSPQFDHGENLDQTSQIQAVVDIFGLSDLTKIGDDFPKEVQEAHKSAGATEALLVNGSPVFGGKDGGILADPAKALAANPVTYISKKTPPFLLMHGDQDRLVSPSQTALLHQALVDKGVDSTNYVVQGAQHNGVYWVQTEVIQIIIAFFDQHLK